MFGDVIDEVLVCGGYVDVDEDLLFELCFVLVGFFGK